jgi:Ca2+-binding EF-hand superfamily protein
MEEFPELFPKSNVQAIANTMPARLAEMGVKINREFRHLDRQGRGYITLKQFRHQIATWAIELGFVDKSGLSEQELDELVRHYNENDDDKIEIGEFQEAFALSKKYQDVHRKRVQTIEGRIYDLVHCQGEASAKAIFRSMDSDGNGKVTYKEFCQFLEDQGFLLNDKERAYIMLRYDADGDGCIEYDEFLRKGQKGSWSGDEQVCYYIFQSIFSLYSVYIQCEGESLN